MKITLGSISKENSNFYAPRFEVEIRDEKLPAVISRSIIDVSVTEEIDVGASFKLTLHDEFDIKTHKFKWLDDSRFNVGSNVTIKMGYGSDMSVMLMGNITSLEPSFFANETPTLTIEGQDLSYDYMKRASPARTFDEKSYSEIVRTVARDAGLLAIVNDTDKFESPISKDNNDTYYAFIKRIAEKIVHFTFYLNGQTLYFTKPGEDKKEILTMELGKDIISFRPALKTTGLLSEVEVRWHNIRDPSKPIIGTAKAGSETNKESGKVTGSELAKKLNPGSKKVITTVVANSKRHADSIALAELIKSSNTLIEGNVESIGIPQIRTGVNILLENMGTRFSKKYYVIKTTHTINDSGYRTSFSVRSNSVEEKTV